MPYRLVIFDFDGTLADTFPWFLGVFDRIAERFRFRRPDPAALETLRGQSAATLMRELGIPAWKVPFIVRHARRLMADDLDRLALFPGIDDLLRDLAGHGVTLAIVSSNSRPNITRVLGPTLSGLFAQSDCGASLGGKARRLRSVVRRAGIAASEAIYIGDELRDHDAARAAGLAFGAVGWGYSRFDALMAQGPDAGFATVEALRADLLPA